MSSVSLIVGGTRGIGLAVKSALISRGDTVYTASRTGSESTNHIIANLPCELKLNSNFKLNYLIFTHRYRGVNLHKDFEVTLRAVCVVVEQLKNSFIGDSSIVIMGSNAGHFAVLEQNSLYHGLRAALEGITRHYAVKLGDLGIRCNVVLPSTIIKKENINFFNPDNDVRKMIEKITPIKKMGTAEDIANCVEFLCSPKSSYITGQSIFVDGGLSVVSQESIARNLLGLN